MTKIEYEQLHNKYLYEPEFNILVNSLVRCLMYGTSMVTMRQALELADVQYANIRINQELHKAMSLLETIHPEKCSCGKTITKREQGINGIDVCEECFLEATKHIRFGG